MIVYWLLYFIAGVLLGLTSPLRILPDATLPAAINSSITSIAGFIGLVWKFMPLTFTALVAAVLVIVLAENWIMVYKVIRWIYKKIPGIT